MYWGFASKIYDQNRAIRPILQKFHINYQIGGFGEQKGDKAECGEHIKN